MHISPLQDFFDQRPSERVYLHFDKTLYYPGEIIWFTAYLRDGMDLSPSQKSDWLHVALFAPDGSLMEEITVGDIEGLIRGDFELGKDALGGMYTIKASTQWQKNEPQTLLFERQIQVQHVILPKLKLQLDFEKESYGLGDQVVATLIAETLQNQAVANAKVMAKTTLNNKEQKWEIGTDKEGKALIKFAIPKALQEKQLLLSVEVQSEEETESIARNIPLLQEGISLDFFPEGGDAVIGRPHQIAFRALNATGQPADCEGVIVDHTGKEITTFNSFHQGMGAFSLTLEKGKKYYAQVLKPQLPENKSRFSLPTALNKGATLQLTETHYSSLHFKIEASHSGPMYLVAQTRGQVLRIETLEITANKPEELIILTLTFPIGVTQFTLFNDKRQAVCERLVFINPHKQLSIKLTTDKAHYTPRERVEMHLEVKDEKGNPVNTSLSLAVTDDNLLNFSADKQGHILSKLLLEPDLNSAIYEPNFYFEQENEKATQALDYLMMTQGWRRFKWEEILSNKAYQPRFEGELLEVSGKVMRLNEGGIHPDSHTTIFASSTASHEFTNKKASVSKANHTGEFCITIPLGKKRIKTLNTYLRNAPKQFILVTTDLKLKLESGELLQDFTISPEHKKQKFQHSSSFQPKIPFILDIDENMDNIYLKGNLEISGIKEGQKALLEVQSAALTIGTETDEEGYFSLKGLRFGTDIIAERGFTLKCYPSSIANASSYNRFEQIVNKYGFYTIEIDERPADAYEATLKLIDEHRRYLLIQHQQAQRAMFAGGGMRSAAKMALPQVGSKTTVAMAALERQLAHAVAPNTKVQRWETTTSTSLFSDTSPSEEQTVANLDLPLKVGRREKALVIANPPHRTIKNGYYYPIREYAPPLYFENEKAAVREDFRSTIYWQGHLKTDAQGKAQISFCNGDSITAFRAIVEGMTGTGEIGRQEHLFHTQIPLQITAEVPTGLLIGDLMKVSVAIRNRYPKDLEANFILKYPKALQPVGKIPKTLVLQANETLRFTIPFEIKSTTEDETPELVLQIETDNDFDGIAKALTISEKGFPIEEAKSSQQAKHSFFLDLKNPRLETVQVNFQIINKQLKELHDAIKGIVREPYGCFEQTSASNYPNILVYQLLAGQNGDSTAIREQTSQYLKNGYKRLLTFESKQGGFEVFGGTPPSTTLTAFALMQFHDMAQLPGLNLVDKQLMQRTEKFLLKMIDDNLDFEQVASRFNYYPLIDQSIANAYCLNALLYTGAIVPQRAIKRIMKKGFESDDPYELALITNARFCLLKQNKNNALENQLPSSDQYIKKLLSLQSEDGSWQGTRHSLTHSTSTNLKIETTSLAILACLQAKELSFKTLNAGINFLFESRNGFGRYGSTQATVLALKAILAHTGPIHHQKVPQGTNSFQLLINKQLAHKGTYNPNEDQQIDGLGKFLKEGQNQVEVKFNAAKAPKHTIALRYYSLQPAIQSECSMFIKTSLPKTCHLGDFVPLSIQIENKANKVAPMPMAIIGIPGGLSLQPWQLKELQERLMFDYYEITSTSLVLYFRSIPAHSSRSFEINLKADVQGTYEGQASCTYLYYTDEFKYWEEGNRIQVLSKT